MAVEVWKFHGSPSAWHHTPPAAGDTNPPPETTITVDLSENLSGRSMDCLTAGFWRLVFYTPQAFVAFVPEAPPRLQFINYLSGGAFSVYQGAASFNPDVGQNVGSNPATSGILFPVGGVPVVFNIRLDTRHFIAPGVVAPMALDVTDIFLEQTVTVADTAECSGAGGEGVGGESAGVENLAHRVGFWVAQQGSIARAWHPDRPIDFTSAYDAQGATYGETRLMMEPYKERITVVYAKGDGSDPTTYNIFRKTSHDWGKSWASDPVDNTPLLPGIRHCVEVENYRCGERLDFYQDASDTDDDGSPTGKGLIQVDIYDAQSALVGTFPEDGLGIGGETADDSSFSAFYEPEPGSYLQCTFPVDKERKAYRSYDDGRTWGEQVDEANPAFSPENDQIILFQPAARFF
jgi:hypothetical protein